MADTKLIGSIKVIGLGPGNLDEITPRARRAIEQADVVVGYSRYIELIRSLLDGKKIISTGMMHEADRCRAALDCALDGSRVVVVSSGDAGIYGMAGLVLEMSLEVEPNRRPTVEVVAGVSAVQAAAAVLGAPLTHDFAVISLSDLLTDWELIKRRIECAATGDFVIAFYNPKSHKRVTQIEEARDILLKFRAESTPVGIVRNAGRPDQSSTISTLENFTRETIDMFTLVIVGNSQTFVKDGFMITPRLNSRAQHTPR